MRSRGGLDRRRYRDIADRIERELRGLNLWQEQPPSAETFAFKRPFAADTMAFTQWLQWILVPRLRDVADGRDDPPEQSSVGSYAIRELDGWSDMAPLVETLIDLDGVVGGRR